MTQIREKNPTCYKASYFIKAPSWKILFFFENICIKKKHNTKSNNTKQRLPQQNLKEKNIIFNENHKATPHARPGKKKIRKRAPHTMMRRRFSTTWSCCPLNFLMLINFTSLSPPVIHPQKIQELKKTVFLNKKRCLKLSFKQRKHSKEWKIKTL